MQIKLVLIEDSERYIRELLGLFEQELQLSPDEVLVITSEADFYKEIANWSQEPPAAFVIDVMIPFAFPNEPTEHVPLELQEKALADKFYRAGIRCACYLLSKPALAGVPMFVHSILTDAELASDKAYEPPRSSNVIICPKEANGHGIVKLLSELPSLRRK